jgi:hypothetical protein
VSRGCNGFLLFAFIAVTRSREASSSTVCLHSSHLLALFVSSISRQQLHILLGISPCVVWCVVSPSTTHKSEEGRLTRGRRERHETLIVPPTYRRPNCDARAQETRSRTGYTSAFMDNRSELTRFLYTST